MNQVCLAGNVASDPEMRYTQQGTAVTTFRLATKDGKDTSTFHTVVVFGKSGGEGGMAEACAQYLGKGKKAGVTGRIQNRTWDKPDGSKGYASEVIASTVDFLSPKQEDS